MPGLLQQCGQGYSQCRPPESAHSFSLLPWKGGFVCQVGSGKLWSGFVAQSPGTTSDLLRPAPGMSHAPSLWPSSGGILWDGPGTRSGCRCRLSGISTARACSLRPAGSQFWYFTSWCSVWPTRRSAGRVLGWGLGWGQLGHFPSQMGSDCWRGLS